MIFRRPYLWILAILGLLPLLLYGRSLGNGFVHWDDGLLIVDNPWIRGLTGENIRHVFTSYDPELYIPLTLIAYQKIYMIAGLEPFFYHATDLLLHIVNVLLVWGISFKLTKKTLAAFVTALILAIHPLHAEAVAWAAALKDVLSTTYLLGSLLLFLHYRSTGRRLWYGLSLLSFLFGLLSKVSILTAPFVLMLMDWLQGEIPWKKSLRDALPYFGLSVIFGIVSLFGKITPGGFVLEKILIGAKATMLLLGKLVFPMNLAVLYPYTRDISVTNPDLLFSVFAVIAITIFCVWLTRWSKWPLFAWSILLLFLIPSFANILKGRNELLDVYVTSDRYAYAASLGPLLLAGIFFDEIRRRWEWAVWSVFGGVTIVFCVLTYRQSLTWKDSESLFRHTLTVSPNSYIAHQNLGTIAVRRGQIDEGLKEYEAAIAIRPDAVAYYNIGLIMESRGDIPAAIDAFRKAVEASPLEEDAAARLRMLER